MKKHPHSLYIPSLILSLASLNNGTLLSHSTGYMFTFTYDEKTRNEFSTAEGILVWGSFSLAASLGSGLTGYIVNL